MEIWRYSHTGTVGCKKSINIDYYYSSEGRLKKIYSNGKEEIKTPTHKGKLGERIYITIAKLFPEICGEYFEGCQVDHLNTNPLDNRAENLRCCTAKENMRNPLTVEHCKKAMKKRWENGVYDNRFKKNKIPWNKGLTKETDERIMRMSNKNRKKK